MEPLDLDYVKKFSWPGAPGLITLSLGIMASIAVALYTWGLQRDFARLDQQQHILITRLRPVAAGQRSAPGNRQSTVTAARALSIPWQPLLSAIEDSASDAVTVDSIKTESDESRFDLRGEAKNTEAMLTFLAALQQAKAVQAASISSQRQDVSDGHPIIKFDMTGQWRTRSR